MSGCEWPTLCLSHGGGVHDRTVGPRCGRPWTAARLGCWQPEATSQNPLAPLGAGSCPVSLPRTSGAPQGLVCDSDSLMLNRRQGCSMATCRKSRWHVAVKDARTRPPQPPRPSLTEGLVSAGAGGPSPCHVHRGATLRPLNVLSSPPRGELRGHWWLLPTSPGLTATAGGHLEAGVPAGHYRDGFLTVLQTLNSAPLPKHH